MNGRAQWSYVQARLQARHGERLQESDWRALEAARSFDHFVERSRATALRRFAQPVSGRMTSHAIERILRRAWQTYVLEVSAWVARDWRSAVVWTAYFPDLPTIDALLRGDAPGWAQQDEAFAAFIEGHPQDRIARVEKSPLAPLTPSRAGEMTLVERWYGHWRSLWPRMRTADERRLTSLAEAMNAQFEQLAQATAQETSGPYRRHLALTVTRLFRRHSFSPVALFCHLILVALDLERLRGGLIRRRLFEPGHAEDLA